MGGVSTDADGRTSVPGLWACGEVASTGVHGANRLASNSLLEAVVFAARVAADIDGLDLSEAPPIGQDNMAQHLLPTGDHEAATIEQLRAIMGTHVGVIRSADGLKQAISELDALERGQRNSALLGNMFLVARLIATAALNRAESRGGHFRSDFPEANPALAHRSYLALAGASDRNKPVEPQKALLP